MTYRMVLQARHLIAAPMLQLVPAFAHLDELDQKEIARLYSSAVMGAVLAGAPIFLLIAIVSPAISRVWMGEYDASFVFFTILLCLGWFVNGVSTPAYYLGMSSGRVRWNIAGHLITTLGGPTLSYAFGTWFGSDALVLAISSSLAAGSAYTMVLNCSSSGVKAFPPLKTIALELQARFRGFVSQIG